MVEKIKADVDRLLLVLTMKKNVPIYFAKIQLSTSVFIFSTKFPNFMYFGHKHVENGPNYSHKLVTFLKYHIPLR